jgi:hypothetical protein
VIHNQSKLFLSATAAASTCLLFILNVTLTKLTLTVQSGVLKLKQKKSLLSLNSEKSADFCNGATTTKPDKAKSLGSLPSQQISL